MKYVYKYYNLLNNYLEYSIIYVENIKFIIQKL
jgi:hypothetical protein